MKYIFHISSLRDFHQIYSDLLLEDDERLEVKKSKLYVSFTYEDSPIIYCSWIKIIKAFNQYFKYSYSNFISDILNIPQVY